VIILSSQKFRIIFGPVFWGQIKMWFPLIVDAGVKGWVGYFLGFLVGAIFMAFKIDLGEQ
jgi:hypothetical protein